jgi:integron integrase
MAERKLLDQLADHLRMKHYSRKTIDAYVNWCRQYILFHNKRHPREMGLTEIKGFLSHLANVRHVAGSTQNQAYYAVRYLYQNVLGLEIGDIEALAAKTAKRMPTVLSREDTSKVLDMVDGEPFNLMARLLYGSGLRLQECQQLRFKDIDFGNHIIEVRGGKGDKDRTVPLPKSLVKPLMDQMAIARRLHEIDIQRGMPGVQVPGALDVKYKNVGCEIGWFWVFPAQNYSIDPETKIRRRHHQHESELQRAIRAAALRAGVLKHVTPHTFRHCFATHLLWAGYDIRTVQELMGHKSVKTTMVYLHILYPAGWKGVQSPLDNNPVESLICS